MCCGGSCAAPCATPICSAPKEPLMHRLVPALIDEMGVAYPELVRAQPLIEEVLEARGNPLPPDARQRPAAARRGDRGAGRSGRDAARRDRVQALRHLRLPLRPHRRRAARAQGFGVDRAGFDAAMAQQKAAARAAWKGSGARAVGANSGSTSPNAKGATEFTGYGSTEARARSSRWCATARRSTAPRRATRSPS